MKKIILALLAFSVVAASCKKERSAPDPLPSDGVKYMNFTANSSWQYEVTDNLVPETSTYTITSTSRDSTINGKAYHVYTNSDGGANLYYNLNGSDYYTFQDLPATLGSSAVENIYLKDNVAVNTSWTQIYNIELSGFPLTAKITNTIAEKGITKTVNSIVYTEVIHITTTLSITFLGTTLPASALTTDIQSYYAKKVGMIESKNKIHLDYMTFTDDVDQHTILKSSDIK